MQVRARSPGPRVSTVTYLGSTFNPALTIAGDASFRSSATAKTVVYQIVGAIVGGLLATYAGASDALSISSGGLSDGGRSMIAELLLAANATTELRDFSGRTALHAAAVAGHEGVVQALLEAGAYADARDNEGMRPMLMATATRQEDVVALLKAHGAEDVTAEEEESLRGRSTLRVEIKPFMRMPS